MTAVAPPWRTPAKRFGRTYPERFADAEMHLWPNLTARCDVCGWPVDRFARPVHPCCEVTT